MCLAEMLRQLMELGKPHLYVGCYKRPDRDTHVQVRLELAGDATLLRWSWFSFEDDQSIVGSCGLAELYAEAAESNEWYLDEIPE